MAIATLSRFTPGSNTAITINFLCSAVDLFAFLYTLARNGDHTWRTSGSYTYLGSREDIYDAIMSSGPLYRRLTNIPVANPSPGTEYQPYIMHTTDEYNLENSGSTYPTHAVCFRTLDATTSPAGGAKLGIYSKWPASGGVETSYIPNTSGQQFEFYNYNSPEENIGEAGNDYFNSSYSSLITQYLNNFQGGGSSSLANQQLYAVPSTGGFLSAWQEAWEAYFGVTSAPTPPLYLP